MLISNFIGISNWLGRFLFSNLTSNPRPCLYTYVPLLHIRVTFLVYVIMLEFQYLIWEINRSLPAFIVDKQLWLIAHYKIETFSPVNELNELRLCVLQLITHCTLTIIGLLVILYCWLNICVLCMHAMFKCPLVRENCFRNDRFVQN